MPDSPAISTQLHGIIVLNKPVGLSSAQCLATFKKQGQKKIGHAGTLDPGASGVLPILLGEATKLATWLLKGGRKVYTGRIRLGTETDTWDMEGRILAEKPWNKLAPAQIENEIRSWQKITEQAVPPFSAAKQNGQPLYKLARKGLPVVSKCKTVQIFEVGILAIGMPFVDFRVSCSSGTYIRSLAHSLGQRLGCGACLESLTREFSQPFDLAQSCTLEEIRAGCWPDRLLPLPSALPHWHRVQVSPEEKKQIRDGRPLSAPDDANGPCFLICNEETLAVAEAKATERGKKWVIVRGLWNF